MVAGFTFGAISLCTSASLRSKEAVMVVCEQQGEGGGPGRQPHISQRQSTVVLSLGIHWGPITAVPSQPTAVRG